MSDLLWEQEGTKIIMDDIIVHGKSNAEHDARLEEVLDTVKESGLKLNKGKWEFRKEEFLVTKLAKMALAQIPKK